MVLRKRQVLAGLGGILLAAGLLTGVLIRSMQAAAPAVSADTNWGLSFQEEGKTPVGNASSEFLSQYGACYAGSPDEKVIYLTFDAGYENGCTPAILDAL